MTNFEYGPVYSCSFTLFGSTIEVESLDRNYIEYYSSIMRVFDSCISFNLDGYNVEAKKYLTLLAAKNKADKLQADVIREMEGFSNEQK